MAESNNSDNPMRDFARKAIENQTATIKSKQIILTVHDDPDRVKSFRDIAATNADSNRLLQVFDNVDECTNFVYNKVSDQPSVNILVFVGGGLVCDVVSEIHACDQVKKIIILNKPPFNEDERNLMKTHSKVIYAADKTTSNSDKTSDVTVTQQTRFNATMTFNLIDGKESDEDNHPCVEPIDRSCKQFDLDFVFRYSMLVCLLNAPPFPSDKNELIKLFETKNLASPVKIEEFKKTYSSSQAILFYTRDAYIYGELNRALRTTNISYLVPFRFLIQDIFNQLRELMLQQTDDQVLTVYRGQQASPYEVADLFTAYYGHKPIAINSFFSTSTERGNAIGFLLTGDPNLFDMNRKPILFKITAQKQNASSYFPFADLSKMTQFSDEKEVLFAPGQMFIINKFDIIHEREINIFLFEMSLDSKVEEYCTAVYDKLKSICDKQIDDPLLHLAVLLTEHKRFDEAKELYTRLLSENIDTKKKTACYQGLFSVAMAQNNTNEAMIMYQKMNETKFDSEHISTNSNIRVSQTDYDQIDRGINQLMNMNSQLSLDRPLDELLGYLESNEYRDTSAQIPNWCYTLSTTLMQNGAYDVAIHYFEMILVIINQSGLGSFDPLLKSRCYMKLGHCYRELKLNDKALENYTLAFEQNTHLPLDEHVETLIGIGKTLEAMNNYEEALHKYIELAEIYQNNSTMGGLEERRDIEETIERITSRLIPKD